MLKKILIPFLCFSAIELTAQGEINPEAAKETRFFELPQLIVEREPLNQAQKAFPDHSCVTDGVYVNAVAVPLLHQNPRFLQKVKEEISNGPLTICKIDEIRAMITRFYLEKGCPFVEVAIPPQSCSKGYVQIIVTEGKLGCIKTEGNCHFSDKSILAPVRCQAGQRIHLPSLLNDLDWINRNPFRRSEAVFTPGQDPGTTDILFKTVDRRPILFYGGADNTGTKETGYPRFYGGFRYGNVFGVGHLLDYQFTSSSSIDKFQSHAGDYQIPLPWKNYLNFFGGWSQTNPTFHHPHMKPTGTSWQVSTRYEIPVNNNPKLAQTFLFGADFKRTNNDLAFGGETIIHHLVDVAQLMFGYDLGGVVKACEWFLSAELYVSPGNIDDNNKTRVFKRLQPGTVSTYVYGWANIGSTFNLPGCWHFALNSTGQYTNQNLLPSEQLELGGYFSVRGYQEHSVNVDEGCFFNAELQTPDFSILAFGKKKCPSDKLHFLAFADYGWGRIHNPVAGEQKIYRLLGIGPGLRYNIKDNVAIRADWGFQMLPIHPHRGTSTTVHAGGYVNF